MLKSRLMGALGVGLLGLSIAACGGSTSTNNSTNTGGGQTPDNTPAAVTISVVSDSATVGKFDPSPAVAKVGDVVKWEFKDSNSQHTVTAEDQSFDSGTKSDGDSFTHKFDTAGTFKYRCTLHADMKGTITVS